MAIPDAHHSNYIDVNDTLYYVGKQGNSQSITKKVKVLFTSDEVSTVYIKLQNIYLMIVYYLIILLIIVWPIWLNSYE